MNKKHLFIIYIAIILLTSFLIYSHYNKKTFEPLEPSEPSTFSFTQPTSKFLKGVKPLSSSQLPKFLQSDEFLENGIEYNPYISLKDYSRIYDFSRDSDFKDFICMAMLEKGDGYLIIRNNQSSGPYNDGMLLLKMSPDGKHIAFIQNHEDKNNGQYQYRVIFNNQISKYYDEVTALSFSPDSQHFMYVIRENDNWFVVFDGKRSEPFESINISYDRYDYDKSQLRNAIYDDVVFSPDSKIFSYFAQRDGKNYLIVNDQKFEIPVDNCLFGKGQAIKFSPDSKRLVFVTSCPREGRHEFYVQMDGYKKGPYTAIKNLMFTQDSEHLVYVAQREEKEFIVFDEKENEGYDYIFGPKLSLDGKHLAYVAKEKNNYYVILDNKKIETLDEFFLSFIKLHTSPRNPWFSWYERLIPVFSSDSQKFAYPIIQDNKWFLVINDEKKEINLDGNNKVIEKILNLTFSPDNQHLAYNVSQYNEDGYNEGGYNEDWVILDNKNFGPYNGLVDYDLDEKLMIFSPDSQHLAYIIVEKLGEAVWSDRLYYLVVDGRKSEVYERIFDFTFSPDSKNIIYFAKKNDQIIRVEKSLKEF